MKGSLLSITLAALVSAAPIKPIVPSGPELTHLMARDASSDSAPTVAPSDDDSILLDTMSGSIRNILAGPSAYFCKTDKQANCNQVTRIRSDMRVNMAGSYAQGMLAVRPGIRDEVLARLEAEKFSQEDDDKEGKKVKKLYQEVMDLTAQYGRGGKGDVFIYKAGDRTKPLGPDYDKLLHDLARELHNDILGPTSTYFCKNHPGKCNEYLLEVPSFVGANMGAAYARGILAAVPEMTEEVLARVHAEMNKQKNDEVMTWYEKVGYGVQMNLPDEDKGPSSDGVRMIGE